MNIQKNSLLPFKPRFGSASAEGYQPARKGSDGKWQIPDRIRIPVIEGDGIGPEIVSQSKRLVDKAVELAYHGKRSIEWLGLQAGEAAMAAGKKLLPDETLAEIRRHGMVVKGPLNTPVGEGFRSINVQLRQLFDLYACIRPVKAMSGVPRPVEAPLDVVIFRENTEDVYAGIEFKEGTWQATLLRGVLKLFGHALPADSAIGIKPVSEKNSKRLVRRAIQYALDEGLPSVTLMHKGNIQKFTEGGFLKWGKEVAAEEFGDKLVSQDDFWKQYGGNLEKIPAGKFVLQECIADNMFQQVTLNPGKHRVIATTNLNGDYLSDDAAANVGGLGVTPGMNVGDDYAMFEAVHGTAPDIAGQNKANPTAMFLTMGMLLDYLRWNQAADLLKNSVEKTLAGLKMTGDLAFKVKGGGVKPLSTTEFTDAVLAQMTEDASIQEKPSAA